MHKYKCIMQSLKAWLAFSAADVHTSLRAIYVNYFNRQFIERQEGMIRRVVTHTLKDITERHNYNDRRFDLVNEFSYPITLNVMASVIGVPVKDLGKGLVFGLFSVVYVYCLFY